MTQNKCCLGLYGWTFKMDDRECLCKQIFGQTGKVAHVSIHEMMHVANDGHTNSTFMGDQTCDNRGDSQY
jgi:hypothetical protein